MCVAGTQWRRRDWTSSCLSTVQWSDARVCEEIFQHWDASLFPQHSAHLPDSTARSQELSAAACLCWWSKEYLTWFGIRIHVDWTMTVVHVVQKSCQLASLRLAFVDYYWPIWVETCHLAWRNAGQFSTFFYLETRHCKPLIVLLLKNPLHTVKVLLHYCVIPR